MKRMNQTKKKGFYRRFLPALFFAGMLTASTLHAQVTIGAEIDPVRGALLELKTQQPHAVTNVTTDKGGFLLPRVALVATNTLQPFVGITEEDWTDDTKKKALSRNLTGLMVYNVATVGSSLYPGVYTWDGEEWVTSEANPSKIETIEQPKAFTFYETGTESAEPLTFTIGGAAGTVSYQWYQVTGNNVHVRIGTPIGGSGTVSGSGATTASFTPTGVIKGTTRNAYNAGFYKFYCEATDSYGQKIQSDIAEVVVGCGAKNLQGEWLSFMCFNLGARNDITIAEQKAYPISYTNDPTYYAHTYISGEENVFGDLYQWGRIPDGHQKRNSAAVARGSMASSHIVSGKRCSVNDAGHPDRQVAKTSTTWYGKFITTAGIADGNWNAYTGGGLDYIWRTSAFFHNDPCMHYKLDGTFQEFWHEGTDESTSGTTACTNPGTGWRIPSQNEWGALYKGGVLSGHPDLAIANTWKWYGSTNSTSISSVRGMELKPDGETTTLFLPANGYRNGNNAQLQYMGTSLLYWSGSAVAPQSYMTDIGASIVNPAGSSARSHGAALRCIKNN